MANETWDMPDQNQSFESRGGWVLNHLVVDLGLTPIQASGIVGNLGGESGLRAINELHPIVPGSRGGWSWAQWTGDRRNQFEKFCKDNGFDLSSDEGAYKFLIWELNNTEIKALTQLKKTTAVEAAVYTFEVLFERPSDPQGGLASRVHFAQRALAGASQLPSPPGPTLPKSQIDPDSDNMAEELNRQELERLGIKTETKVEEVQAPKSETKTTTTVTKSETSSNIIPPPPNNLPPGVQVINPGGLPSDILSKIPWWVLPGLGVFVMCIFAGALAASCFMDNDTLRTQMFSYAAAGFTTALGFFFGSSTGSREKDAKTSPIVLTGTGT